MNGICAAVPEAVRFAKYLELSLASLAPVRKAATAAAATFSAENDRLVVLMNNVGIMAQLPARTKDGFEIQFGTNHMGHALLTKELLPILAKTAASPKSDVRIINLCSKVHKLAPRSAGFLLEEC